MENTSEILNKPSFWDALIEFQLKKGMPSLDEILESDLQHSEVKDFLQRYDIDLKSDTYKRGRSALHEFVNATYNDPIRIPVLQLYNGNIWVAYKYRSERLRDYYTNKPKAKYDKSVSHLIGLSSKDIELDHGNSKAVSFMRAFINTYKEKPKQKGMYLIGSMGIGKTYLMGCLAGELKKNNIAFEFIGMQNFMNELNSMMNDYGPNLQKRKKEVQEIPVLIIDDLGLERASAWALQTLTDILIPRYENQLPTFVTSNLTKADYCKQLLTGKEVNKSQTDRLYSKALQPLNVEIGMSGRNRRLDN